MYATVSDITAIYPECSCHHFVGVSTVLSRTALGPFLQPSHYAWTLQLCLPHPFCAFDPVLENGSNILISRAGQYPPQQTHPQSCPFSLLNVFRMCLCLRSPLLLRPPSVLLGWLQQSPHWPPASSSVPFQSSIQQPVSSI